MVSNERREQYENELVEHPVYDDDTLRYAVDAVMAVADEEIQEWREEYTALRTRYDSLLSLNQTLALENKSLRERLSNDI